MATKSITQNVKIKDAYFARKLANALENAKKIKSKKISFSRDVETVDKKDIKAFFGE